MMMTNRIIIFIKNMAKFNYYLAHNMTLSVTLCRENMFFIYKITFDTVTYAVGTLTALF